MKKIFKTVFPFILILVFSITALATSFEDWYYNSDYVQYKNSKIHYFEYVFNNDGGKDGGQVYLTVSYDELLICCFDSQGNSFYYEDNKTNNGKWSASLVDYRNVLVNTFDSNLNDYKDYAFGITSFGNEQILGGSNYVIVKNRNDFNAIKDGKLKADKDNSILADNLYFDKNGNIQEVLDKDGSEILSVPKEVKFVRSGDYKVTWLIENDKKSAELELWLGWKGQCKDNALFGKKYEVDFQPRLYKTVDALQGYINFSDDWFWSLFKSDLIDINNGNSPNAVYTDYYYFRLRYKMRDGKYNMYSNFVSGVYDVKNNKYTLQEDSYINGNVNGDTEIKGDSEYVPSEDIKPNSEGAGQGLIGTLESIANFIPNAIDRIKSLGESASGFASVFGKVFNFFPTEFSTIILVGIVIVVVLRIFKR